MDSVLSLKQAINSSYGKNHIGAYHVPEAVYVDLELFQTLPARELRSGLCETAKNCLAIRPASLPVLRELLAGGDLASVAALQWQLEESLAAKSAVTVGDPKEQHAGLVLEYGHTVGHAIELCDQRIRGAASLSHGEAVALGLLVAARAAQALGTLGDAAVRAHTEVVSALGVSDRLPRGVSVSDVMTVSKADNTRGYLSLRDDETGMVLLRDLGAPIAGPDRPLTPVPLSLVERCVTELASDTETVHLRGADDPTERIRQAWSESLGIRVDDDTDFFHAGGTSLMAMHVIAILDDAYAIQVPLRALFDNPRFDEFARAIGRELRSTSFLGAGGGTDASGRVSTAGTA